MAGLTDPEHVAGLLHGTDVRPLLSTSSTLSCTSMIGLAASPMTEVEPTCSVRLATSPRAEEICCRSFSKMADRVGSQS